MDDQSFSMQQISGQNNLGRGVAKLLQSNIPQCSQGVVCVRVQIVETTSSPFAVA